MVRGRGDRGGQAACRREQSSLASRAAGRRAEAGSDSGPELPFGSSLRITRSDVEDLMTPEDCTAFGELLARTFESAPAARPVEERWTAACIEAQVTWAQNWQPRVDRVSF